MPMSSLTSPIYSRVFGRGIEDIEGTVDRGTKGRETHGWLTEDKERLGKPDTFIEDFIVSDEERAAEESTPQRTSPKKNTPKTSVTTGRSKTSVPEKTTRRDTLDYNESSSFDSEADKDNHEEDEDSGSQKDEELKTTPDIDQVVANTEVTPDEELLAQNVPLSSTALPKRQSTVRKRSSAVSPTKKPALKKVRHLDLGAVSSDEDKQEAGPSNTSPPDAEFEEQNKDEDLQQIERREPKTSVFFNVTEVFAEAQRVLTRLSALAREHGAPLDNPGDLENILLQAIQGWKKAETGSSSASTLQSELDLCKAELSSAKTKATKATKANTSATARLIKLKEKLSDSRHEEKRSRKRMKSAEKRKKELKEEIKAKDQQLMEVEDRAVFAENEVEVQRRVFVRKFLVMAMDKTSTKTFEQVTEVLEAAKSQPDNQQERHARYTRMGEKVQKTYEDFAHTLQQQIEDLREIVDLLKDLELKTEEEYRDEENTSLNVEGLLQKEFQTQAANTSPDPTLFAWGKEDPVKTSAEVNSPAKKKKAVEAPTRTSPRKQTKTSVVQIE
ncbi:hypothetical protein R1sor_009501 [Riccia sorocarpa]|uniref:Uncharacterized protein n=1 Tax=Riccia sorocarpa TaxID=122646 RepID=A0ABD3HYT0_9MARC